MPVVLGVDGGNTKTLALVADLEGRVVGFGRAGCSDIYSVGDEAGPAAIAAAAGDALAHAGVRGSDVVAAALSLSGADWPEDFVLHAGEAQRRLGLADPLVLNDAIGALLCGTDDAIGVAVVCGTGGAVGARNAAGDVFHLGFWPDGTGGGALGRDAIRLIERAALGLEPPTALTEALWARFGAADATAFLHARTGRYSDPVPPRVLAPLVLDVAAAGDEGARRIVMAQGTILGDYARVAAQRVGLEAGHALVLAGGVLRHRSAGVLIERIAERAGPARIALASVEPAAAAVLWALGRAGVAVADARAGLAASLPGSGFFESAAGG